MEIFLITFLIMVVAMLAMAVGVLFGRRSMQGSCGGLNEIDGLECGICSRPCKKKRQSIRHTDGKTGS